jgi:cytochrome c oxidase accessory protein FixG
MKQGKEAPIIDYDAYRDTIGTVDESGHRKWMYPKKPKGRLHTYRAIVAVILLIGLFSGPFLRINGEPMFLFNLLERKFIIFGLTFWPQDFHLFALALVTFFVFIILFTVAFGRVWCGWACPQTIFMEMVFRKIEYWIEGDAPKQRKLSRQEWDTEKISKRVLKYTIFAIISFFIGNLVMAYMVGTDELSKIITEGPSENMGNFTFVLIFSGLFFFVFSYLREQACIAICPYGRLQGVLLDKDSVVVAYDKVRGETRGRFRKKEDRKATGKGDCIDCSLCVQVCPTGIDIRNGTQLECVNCTACIDVCDEVMDKVGYEPGLIRFASMNNIEQGKTFKYTPKMVAYTVVLVGLLGFLSFSLSTRSDVEATIQRAKGTFYTMEEDGNVSNLYNLQVVNKTQQDFPLTIKVMNLENGEVTIIGKELNILARDITKRPFFVKLPPESLDGMKTKIVLGVFSGDKELDKVKTTFLGPM